MKRFLLAVAGVMLLASPLLSQVTRYPANALTSSTTGNVTRFDNRQDYCPCQIGLGLAGGPWDATAAGLTSWLDSCGPGVIKVCDGEGVESVSATCVMTNMGYLKSPDTGTYCESKGFDLISGDPIISTIPISTTQRTACATAINSVTCGLPLQNGLVAYWDMEEAAGSNRVDEVAAVALVPTNMAATAAGKHNDAGVYTYQQSSLATAATAVLKYTPASGRTYNVWVKLSATNPQYPFIWAQGNGTNGAEITFLYSGGKMYLQFNGFPAPTSTDYTYTTNLLDNAWHMWTVTLDGTGGGSVSKMYLDGNLLTFNEGAGTVPASYLGSYAATPICYIGAYNGANADVNSRFNGSVDEFGVWDRVLALADVQSLYNSGTGKFYNGSIFE